MLGRFSVAVAAASAALLVAVMVGLWLGAVLEGQPAGMAASAVTSHLSFFVVFFGLPLCLTLTALVGGILAGWERKAGRQLSWTWRHIVPAVLASVTLPLVWRWFWGRPVDVVLWLCVGAAGGLVACLAFWSIIGATAEGPV